MDTDAKEEYELTSNPVDGTYGFICRVHGIHRSGLVHGHATNLEAKHIREQHTEDHALTLDLQMDSLATLVLAMHRTASTDILGAHVAVRLWETLVGMEGEEALTLAEKFASGDAPRVAVAPF